jgi:flagellar biosynthesis/type III secretory pathway protein FliH
VTTPPAPPAPAPPAPSPPAPAPPAPPAPAPNGAPTAEDLAKVTAALEEERKRARRLEADLAKAQQQGMTDAEKAIAEAKAAGRAEAEQAANLKLAAAEFRAKAAGRIANPDAALAALDLTKLLGKNGEPDTAAITALVEQLAVVPPPPPPPGYIPPGPREPAPPAGSEVDFIRQIRRR